MLPVDTTDASSLLLVVDVRKGSTVALSVAEEQRVIVPSIDGAVKLLMGVVNGGVS